MSSKCKIEFDNNPLGVYYAGQVISGTAELITTRPKVIRSISINISGFAEARWTENIVKEDTHGKRVQVPETFSSSEVYYSNEQYVYGRIDDQLNLPAGKYVFPFKAIIPPNVPTSMNGAWGHIQHEVSLVVDRVMRYNNIFKQTYTVLSPYDLNLNPNHAKSFHIIEETFFCSLCCSPNDPMVMTTKMPFIAYAPGQKVHFNIVLDNQSNVHCKDVNVQLMKKVVYTSSSPFIKIKQIETKVAEVHCGEVVKHNKAEFNEVLQIPPTTPSSLENCSIIKVSYTLKFIAKVSFLHSDLVIDIPFTIGTVPLYASIAYEEDMATNPVVRAMKYKPISPPMFEEDIRSGQFENNTFKPRYPVYLNNSNLSTNNVIGPSSPPQANVPYNDELIRTASISVPNPSAPPTSVVEMPHPSMVVPDPSKYRYQLKTRTDVNPSQEVLGFSVPPNYEPTPHNYTRNTFLQ